MPIPATMAMADENPKTNNNNGALLFIYSGAPLYWQIAYYDAACACVRACMHAWVCGSTDDDSPQIEKPFVHLENSRSFEFDTKH